MQSAQWQVLLGFFALASLGHDNFHRGFQMLHITLFMIRLLWYVNLLIVVAPRCCLIFEARPV
jgi:hypothetical protein